MTVATQFVPLNYDVFAGLDVDKKSMAVIFTDHQQLKQSLRLPYSAEQLLNYARKHFPEQRVAFAYEAGPTGFGLHDKLVAAGHPCLVVAPQKVPTARGQRVKTNRLDARKLSENLRGGANCAAFMCLRQLSRAASSGPIARYPRQPGDGH